MLVRTESPVHDPAWTVSALSLEDLVLAYMRGTPAEGRSPTLEVAR
ncbi:MAG: transporter ATP-binding protein [Marmoricola sp.]|nr:transporter ATP-binding protein [Marmoricola sp.]